MRDQYLAQKFNNLLSRLSPPRAIAGSEELQRDETLSLVSALKGVAPLGDFDAWWPRFEAALLDGLQTRAWPTRREIKDAAKKINIKRERTESEQFDAWCTMADGRKKPPLGLRDHRVTAEMVKRGHLMNLREARFHGWPLSMEQDQIAVKQKIGWEEFRHHIRVCAKLRGISEAEAESQERAVLSDSEIPERRAA